jgi:hypothetical protein
MRAMLAVTRREIEERWTWLGLSAALALLPLAAPLIGVHDLDLEATVALILFCLLAAVSTLVVGASVMAGDLVQGRLGFLLARPVSWPSIWAGKLVAAMLLSAISIVVFVPALVAARGLLPVVRASMDAVGTVVFLSWFVIGIALAQWVTIGLRSRSAWLLTDLVGLVAAAHVGVRVLARLGMSGALGYDATALAIVLGTVALAFGAATAAPFAFGGVSVRRAHAALSATLWVSLFSVLAIGGLVSDWAAHPRATDFRNIWNGTTDAQGHWVLLIGHGRGRAEQQPALFFTGDDSSTPAPVSTSFIEPWTLALSENGSTAAWIDGRSGFQGGRIDGLAQHVMFAQSSAGAPAARTLDIAVPLEEHGSALALSRTGQRLAVSDSETLRVYELPAGRAITSLPMPAALFDKQALFLDDDTLVIYGRPSRGGVVQIVHASLQTGRTALTGQFAPADWLMLGPKGRLLALNFSQRRATLHDATTGTLLATLADGPSASAPEAVFTSDGQVALLAVSGGHARLRLFSDSGQEEKAVDLGVARGVRLDVDSHGRLLAGSYRPEASRETVVLDPSTLAEIRRLPHVIPLRSAWDKRLRSPRPSGGGGVDLFLDAERRIVRLDVDSGKSEVVIGPRG